MYTGRFSTSADALLTRGLMQMGIISFLKTHPSKAVVTKTKTENIADGNELFHGYIWYPVHWTPENVELLTDSILRKLEDVLSEDEQIGVRVDSQFFDEDHPLTQAVLIIITFDQETEFEDGDIANYIEESMVEASQKDVD